MEKYKPAAARIAITALLVPALCVCLHLVGRTLLYWENGAKPYFNHVDAGYFESVREACFEALPFASAAVLLSFILKKRGMLIAALLIAMTCLATPGIFEYYHSHKILVTYDEFVNAGGV